MPPVPDLRCPKPFPARPPARGRRLLAALTLAAGLSWPGLPALADFDSGVAAYSRGQYAEAYRLLEPLAEAGDPQAQTYLAEMLRYGDGIPTDYKRSAYWYEQAAQQGHAEAQSILGLYYSEGIGVERNYETAFEWFLKAARQGDANAQNSLGSLLKNGLGVPEDEAAAFEWYRKAAEQGHPIAQKNVGRAYERGQGTRIDPVRAYAWFKVSAERGYKASRSHLSFLLPNMTRSQIEEAERLAAEISARLPD